MNTEQFDLLIQLVTAIIFLFSFYHGLNSGLKK